MRLDLISEYADVLLGEAERARPFPILVDHLLMQKFEPRDRKKPHFQLSSSRTPITAIWTANVYIDNLPVCQILAYELMRAGSVVCRVIPSSRDDKD